MKLSELKSLLAEHSDLYFRLGLPGGGAVPVSFHITEVGHVRKKFIDCGGTLRETECCLLQVWVGEDYGHRIETGKMAGILEKGARVVEDDSVPVEVEYGDGVVSQYKIEGHEVTDEAVVLKLAHKHTECLAPELCGLPSIERLPSAGVGSCCGPGGCC